MSRFLAVCGALALTLMLALPGPANAAERRGGGLKNNDMTEFSAQRRARRAYYRPGWRVRRAAWRGYPGWRVRRAAYWGGYPGWRVRRAAYWGGYPGWRVRRAAYWGGYGYPYAYPYVVPRPVVAVSIGPAWGWGPGFGWGRRFWW
jgi:hypothetical protein